MRATTPLAASSGSGQQPTTPASNPIVRSFTLLLLTSLALLTVNLHAAIPVGVVQTFSTQPPVEDWSTITNGGDNASFVDVAAFEVGIQTNVASAITIPLPLATADGTANSARYLSNATTGLVLMRPT